MNGQAWQELALVDYACKADVAYALKVIARADLIQVFVNNRMVIHTRDSTYTKGLAGLRVVDTQAEFDDVIMRAE